LAGPGSVEAARIAVEEFGGEVGGVPVEMVFGDHQNKPERPFRGRPIRNEDLIVDGATPADQNGMAPRPGQGPTFRHVPIDRMGAG
jgi:hypothetical protein